MMWKDYSSIAPRGGLLQNGKVQSSKPGKNKLSIMLTCLLVASCIVSFVCFFRNPDPVIPPEKNELNTEILDCSTFDPKEVKLITFDVFAALMDTMASLTAAIERVAPGLQDDKVAQLANAMMDGYGSYMGKTFTPEQTRGLEPFQFVVRTTLAAALANLALTAAIPPYGEAFEELIRSWGRLIPHPKTHSTLRILSQSFMLAPLSNGDKDTLTRAVRVFKPDVRMSYAFSSDWPVGSFKPLAPIYQQVPLSSGLSPRQILHVAGGDFDAKGAREHGLFSALLFANSSTGDHRPCFVLEDIGGLLDVFGLGNADEQSTSAPVS